MIQKGGFGQGVLIPFWGILFSNHRSKSLKHWSFTSKIAISTYGASNPLEKIPNFIGSQSNYQRRISKFLISHSDRGSRFDSWDGEVLYCWPLPGIQCFGLSGFLCLGLPAFRLSVSALLDHSSIFVCVGLPAFRLSVSDPLDPGIPLCYQLARWMPHTQARDGVPILA